MDEVRESERRRTVMELLYLKVCARFVKLQVPLVKPMPASGGVVQLGSANLKVLTDELYSKDALALVREHLMQFAGPGDVTWTSPMGSWVMIPLLQAGQVYAISAMFGYYLRQMDARYQLEKLVGAASGDTSGSDEEDRTLKEYISTFGEAEMKRMTNIASVEGRLALEAQVAALFGDLRVLKEKFAAAIGPVFSEEEAIGMNPPEMLWLTWGWDPRGPDPTSPSSADRGSGAAVWPAQVRDSALAAFGQRRAGLQLARG
ncbi:unnamed protein product [Prorocentrum cordatum]|uniref:Uncharacterized protein n=1 Tax=Prorocentrum cordatum TaxID=2364126 RepID=A0ABN9X0G4_9DINO|nr:unnamed protein product [Polarella glacialis]